MKFDTITKVRNSLVSDLENSMLEEDIRIRSFDDEEVEFQLVKKVKMQPITDIFVRDFLHFIRTSSDSELNVNNKWTKWKHLQSKEEFRLVKQRKRNE